MLSSSLCLARFYLSGYRDISLEILNHPHSFPALQNSLLLRRFNTAFASIFSSHAYPFPTLTPCLFSNSDKSQCFAFEESFCISLKKKKKKSQLQLLKCFPSHSRRQDRYTQCRWRLRWCWLVGWLVGVSTSPKADIKCRNSVLSCSL